jgi:hypothetical protein
MMLVAKWRNLSSGDLKGPSAWTIAGFSTNRRGWRRYRRRYHKAEDDAVRYAAIWIYVPRSFGPTCSNRGSPNAGLETGSLRVLTVEIDVGVDTVMLGETRESQRRL